MTALFDTSTLIAGMVESHPDHERCSAWLRQAAKHELDAFVSSHSLAEVYSVLTRTPFRPPISASAAWEAIRKNVLAHMTVVALLPEDYTSVLERDARAGIIGGATYDSLIVHAARKAGVEHLITLNEKHFKRLSEDDGDWVRPA